jgi:four helix bundle protein
MENGKWKMGERSADIPTRAFDVGVRVVKFCEYLYARRGVSKLMAAQILAAGTSVGANVQEGQAAQSRADFIAKYSISLKEAREAAYRMRLLMAAEVVPAPRVATLVTDVEELAKMLGRAIVTAKRNRSPS